MIEEARTYFVELEPSARQQHAAYAVSISLVHPKLEADPVRVSYDVKRKLWAIDVRREGRWVESATVRAAELERAP